MRRPSWQFYPGDWQSNPKLRRCSHAEKGVWLDVLCILHDQDEYGIIRWPLKDLALAVHAKPALLQGLVDKGVLKGTDAGSTCPPFIYTPRHGGKDGSPVTLIGEQQGPLWYSSRMVRDEHIRQVRSNNGMESKVEPKATPKVGIGGSIGQALRSDPSRAGASSSTSSSFSSSLSLNSEAATHTQGTETRRNGVCVVKSRFSLDKNLEYAWAAYHNDAGIDKPDAWAAGNLNTGKYDDLVAQYLEDPNNFFPKKVVKL